MHEASIDWTTLSRTIVVAVASDLRHVGGVKLERDCGRWDQSRQAKIQWAEVKMRVARGKGSSRRACRRSNRRSLSCILSEDQDSSLNH